MLPLLVEARLEAAPSCGPALIAWISIIGNGDKTITRVLQSEFHKEPSSNYSGSNVQHLDINIDIRVIVF